MTSVIDIFAPYLPTIITIIVIFVNILFLIKSVSSAGGFNIVGWLIFNIILAVITNVLALIVPSLDGYIQYDLISIIFRFIIDLFEELGSDIWNLIF